MAYIEMRWRCAYCRKENLGRDRECVGCTHPRDENVKFYMPGQGEMHRVEKIENTNPDWICGFCNCLNKDGVNTCVGCGAPRRADTQSYFDNKQGYSGLFDLNGKPVDSMDQLTGEPGNTSGSDSFSAGSSGYDDNVGTNSTGSSAASGYSNSMSRKGWRKFFIICAAIIAIVLGAKGLGSLVNRINNLPKKCTVVAMEWDATTEIEEERTFRETDWVLPAAAREVSRSQEIHHYDDILNHYETVQEERSRQVLDHYEDVEVQKSRRVIDHYKTVEERKSRTVLDHYEERVIGYRDLGNGYAEEITTREPVYKTEYYTESHQEPVYKTEYYTETHQEPVYRTEYYTEDVQKPVYDHVPVYKTQYVYDIERWVYARTVVSSSKAQTKAWTDLNLNEKERASETKETYRFTVTDKKGRSHTFDTIEEVWKQINVGMVIKVDWADDYAYEVKVIKR